jgi:hypothetical protein
MLKSEVDPAKLQQRGLEHSSDTDVFKLDQATKHIGSRIGSRLDQHPARAAYVNLRVSIQISDELKCTKK